MGWDTVGINKVTKGYWRTLGGGVKGTYTHDRAYIILALYRGGEMKGIRARLEGFIVIFNLISLKISRRSYIKY